MVVCLSPGVSWYGIQPPRDLLSVSGIEHDWKTIHVLLSSSPQYNFLNWNYFKSISTIYRQTSHSGSAVSLWGASGTGTVLENDGDRIIFTFNKISELTKSNKIDLAISSTKLYRNEAK